MELAGLSRLVYYQFILLANLGIPQHLFKCN